MSKEVRGIVTGLNIAVSFFVSELIVRYVFWDILGFRLLIMFLALLFCSYKALCECEGYFIRKGGKKRNEGKNRRSAGASAENDAEGIPWFKMRYSEIVKGNRNT